MRYERDEWDELERQARHDRAIYLAELISGAAAWVARAARRIGQPISKAWRSSSASGTNSSALS